jgi:hypothetical protein
MKLHKLALILLIPFLLAGSLPSLKYRALDADGDPISGAKLYFYEAGTSTPAATYPTQADEIAESNANANPVVADSDGFFGSIFMQTDQEYKVVLKNSDDSTTYFTLDNIDANQLVDSGLETRIKQVASNPLDYRSAVGDGVADEVDAVQDAIDNATGVVDLLGKTFRCDSAITMASNLTLKNGTLDFTNSTDSVHIITLGAYRGSAVSVSANITAGDTSIDIDSTTGFAAGDWVYLTSTAAYISGGDTTSELIQVQSVTDSDTLALIHGTQKAYTTANSATAREVTMISNVTFEDLTISLPVGGSTTIGIQAAFGENITIKDSRFTGARSEAIAITSSVEVQVVNTTFNLANSTNGAGVAVEQASRDILIDSCYFNWGQYGININSGYPVRWVTIKDSFFNGPEDHIYIEGYIEDLVVRGNNFYDDGGSTAQIYGLSTGAVVNNLKITDNVFHDGNAGIDLSSIHVGITGNIDITNNLMHDGGIDITEDANSSGTIDVINIADNFLGNGTITIAAGTGSGAWNYVNIIDNELKSGDIDVTQVEVGAKINGNTLVSGDLTLTDMAVSGEVKNNNLVSGTITIADNATATTDVKSINASGNQLDAGDLDLACSSGSGSFERVILNNNTFDNGKITVTGVVASTAIDNVTIANNIITTASAEVPIDIDDVGMVSILNNQVAGASATYGIEVTTIDNALIMGNTIAKADIRLLDDAGANVTSESIRVVNNHLLDGQISMVGAGSTSTYDRILISGNTMEDGEIIVTESATTTFADLSVDNNILSTTAVKAIDVIDVGNISVTDNKITGDGATTTDGIEIAESDNAVYVKGNIISGMTADTDFAIDIDAGASTTTVDSIVVESNYIVSGYAQVYSNVASTFTEVRITGNTLKDGRLVLSMGAGGAITNRAIINNNNVYTNNATSLIDVDDVYNVSVLGNTVIGDDTNVTFAIHVDGTPADTTSTIINNNYIGGVLSSDIIVIEMDRVVINGNFSDGQSASSSNQCIDVQEGTSINISGNLFDTCGGLGIEIENSTVQIDEINISGNTFTTTEESIFLNQTFATPSGDSQAATIAGNILAGSPSDHMISIVGYLSKIVISGNTLRKTGDNATDGVNTTGTAAGSIDDVTIIGNHFYNGTYAVGEGTDGNSTNIKAHSNSFENIGTAIYENYATVSQQDITSYNVGVGACIIGDIAYDTGNTAEICFCVSANTWYCVDPSAGPPATWDTTGPAD